MPTVEQTAETRPSLLLRLRTDTDREAWQQFADAYAPLIHGFLVSRKMQDADALDVTQDVLATVARDIRKFEHCADRPGSFRRWLFTIVRHRTIDHRRKEKRHPRGSGETVAQQLLAEIEAESAQLEEQWNRDQADTPHWPVLGQILDSPGGIPRYKTPSTSD